MSDVSVTEVEVQMLYLNEFGCDEYCGNSSELQFLFRLWRFRPLVECINQVDYYEEYVLLFHLAYLSAMEYPINKFSTKRICDLFV